MGRFLVRFGVFLGSLLLLLELVVFRVVFPACEEPAYVLDPETHLPRFDPSYGTSGTFTFGRVPTVGAEWRINNAGWISAFDFYPRAEGDTTFRVAVLGDSYIENFYTQLDQHIDALLDRMLGPGYEVWGFGRSGSYLFQYVVLCRELDSLYDPDLFVVFLNNNDVRSSLADMGTPTRYYYQISSTDSGYVEVPPAPFSRNRFRKHLRHSALLRYLTANTRLGWFAEVQREARMEGLVATISEARQDTVLMAQLSDAAEYMLQTLVDEHPGKRFLFVGDAMRQHIYDGSTDSESYLDCTIVQGICDTMPDCLFLDLTEVYRSAWERDGRRFEYDNNWHWNAYGDSVVASGVGVEIVQLQLR